MSWKHYHAKRSTSLISTDDEGRPTFAVKAVNFRTRGGWGCSLEFICPKCGRKNGHTGVYGKPGAADGRRSSPCGCWPKEYYIKEIVS